MNKACKKLLTVLTAATLLASTTVLGACNYTSKPLSDNPATDAAVTSQGGWVVKKGGYYYFINGTVQGEALTVDDEGNESNFVYDNGYGEINKGSLQRIKESDMKAGNYDKAEMVVPLVVTVENYSAGVFIYGDYVYYATPTTATNLEGERESGYVDFKRSKIDGSETMQGYYFRSAKASDDYRFVEVDGVVYCLHVQNGALYSYNTQTGKDNILVKNIGSYFFYENADDKANAAYVYYTMNVTRDVDKGNSSKQNYNQVYRVRADATAELKTSGKTATYTVKGGKAYTFDLDSIKSLAQQGDVEFKANDIEYYPYVNLGELVLDGIGQKDAPTQYNQSATANGEAQTADGYTYSLIKYANGGLYYTRNSLTGSASETYFLKLDKIGANWNAVTANADAANNGGEFHDIIETYGGKVKEAVQFYIDKDGNHVYLYNDTASVKRVTVVNGVAQEPVTIATKTTLGTVLYMDDPASNAAYKYIYYSANNGDSTTVCRIVYDSAEGINDNTFSWFYEDDYKEYCTVSVNQLSHATGWYPPEVIDGYIFYLPTDTVGSVTYDYAHVVDMHKANGDVMSNVELAEINEKLDKLDDVFADATSFDNKAYNAIYYYYFTGETALYDDKVETDKADKNQYYTFSRSAQAYFDAYKNGTDYDANGVKANFSEVANYNTRNAFYHQIGLVSEAEQEELDGVWKITYLSGTVEEEDDSGLPAWAIALIVVGSVVGALGVACAITIPLVLRSKKKKAVDNGPKAKKYTVDMTDDESIDVYADEKAEAEVSEENKDAE